MMQRRRNMVRIGALSAIGGLILLPMVSGRVRKRMGRTGRNAFFRVTDYIQDMIDMRK